MSKIIILSNQANSLAIFWRVLIRRLEAGGNEIVCVVPSGETDAESKIADLGARASFYNLDRKGLNPLADWETLRQLKKIFFKERPDVVFATTIKPVIYGCLAARATGVPCVFAVITGLGYAFEADSPIKKIINLVARLLYKSSLRSASGVFFQNKDDLNLFRNQKILAPGATVHIARGTGVDLRKFARAPLPETEEGVVFLLVARLLEAKGLWEYVRAAKKLKAKYPKARFLLLGPEEKGRGSIDVETVRGWRGDGVEYMGATNDVRPWLAKAAVVVLPSWREGMPTAIMEAMSVGRPCVVSDAPGCREVVENGVNGFVHKTGDADSLADAMENFLLRPELIADMGQKGREMAENKFDAEKVAAFMIERARDACPLLGGARGDAK